MFKKQLFLCALAWLLPVLALPAYAEPKILTIAADVWCPINCGAESERPGIGVELAKKIFEPLGHRVNYVVMPWARALEEVRTGKVDAVVGANLGDDPHLLFPRHAIYRMTDDFYALRDRLAFENMDSLKERRLGIIRDYGYGEIVTGFVAEARKTPGLVQETGGDDALEQNIRKLLAGRIDVIIESSAVMDYTLAKLKLEKEIKRIGGVPQYDVYLAFSPALSDSKERLRLYDKGIAKLKATGALQPLYASYRLQAP